MISNESARVGPPLAPSETLAVALAVTVLSISAGLVAFGFLTLGIAVGFIAAALRRRFGRGPRLVLLVAFAPTAFLLNERGALGIALIIVPWMIDAMLTWRSADEDVLVHALAAATTGLALVAEIVSPWQLAIPLLQIFVSIHGLADVALRRRDVPRLHAVAPTAKRLVDLRLARATARFTLLFLALGGLVFALVPLRDSASRNGTSTPDGDSTAPKHPHGW
ncbi:MAG: hypothetical protein HYR85_09905, partial [Planctomycetes bacterium]|nr:hypothetical protein [Planctomycetota bacterium]